MFDSLLRQRVTVLGSTGSIGKNTLDVIAKHPERFEVTALSARQDVDTLYEQIDRFRPEQVGVVDDISATQLHKRLREKGIQCEIIAGANGNEQLAQAPEQIVVCGIVGAVGLLPTIAAVKAGNKVLIANKEPLVMLGHHIMALARQHGALILPLDSEHNAIFQCFGSDIESLHGRGPVTQIRRILLTGSGGPFLNRQRAALSDITPEEACKHPNWTMGRKISVDSATMMNKGLELVEACVLFAVNERKVDIVIHPESVVHSMVEYLDGSVVAQMATADMRVPIAQGLSWPDRIESGAQAPNFAELTGLTFHAPDVQQFPALSLAREAAQSQGTLPTIMNAANEVAVAAFLQQRIGFLAITDIVARAMNDLEATSSIDLETALTADVSTRDYCNVLINKMTS